MGGKLQEMTEQWMRMGRQTREQWAAAEEFYERELLHLVAEDYVRRNKEKVFEDVEYLVMSVGTSIEPLVLNISLFQPKKVLFLCTTRTEVLLDKIVEHCALSPSTYQKEIVDSTKPTDIYREIKNGYLEWGKPEKIYIDFTGGTKAMSAAAALAGAMIRVELVYVGTTNYLTGMRKPEPGTETLYFIDNPVTVFGDLEIEKAMAFFDEGNYTGAKEKLCVLRKEVPEPEIRQQLEFAESLANAYEAWDSLDFVAAEAKMSELNAALRRDARTHENFLLMDFRAHLSEQGRILGHLRTIPEKTHEGRQMEILKDGSLMAELIFTMWQNASIRERQAKYDMASLLLYRVLEMIMQKRLADYNLYASQVRYEDLDMSKVKDVTVHTREDLCRKMNETRRGVFRTTRDRDLPDPVSLLDGYMLLFALGDEISQSGSEHRPYDFLKRLRSMVYLRNNSIFAHGLGPVGQEDYEKFRAFVLEVLTKHCLLEEIQIVDYQNRIRWIAPRESRYFANLV